MKSENNKITFLLGAGASYGHIINGITPPIMKEFFSSSAKSNILTKEKFPQLVQCIQKHALNSNNILEACENIESTGCDLEKFLGNLDNKNADQFFALHLALFYIHEYLGTFCNKELDCNSAYAKLASYIKNHYKNINGIISLNYDTLFDQALKNLEIDINYGFQTHKQGKLFYIKPHGSINFRFLYSKYISLPCDSWDNYIKNKNSTILTNIFKAQIEEYNPQYNFEKDFIENNTLKYIPSIVLPLGKNKEHFQFYSYMAMWCQIKSLLESTTQLTIIGCAMNESDDLLWYHINSYLDKNTPIEIISKDETEAVNIKNKFNRRGFKKVTTNNKGFYHYEYSN